MKIITIMFGNFRYFLYLCNVIKRDYKKREPATRCSWPDDSLIP